MLCAGDSARSVLIELQRLGVEAIAVDRYADAPGQQVAHRAHVIAMTDGALRALIERERPHIIVPEIEGNRHRRAGGHRGGRACDRHPHRAPRS